MVLIEKIDKRINKLVNDSIKFKFRISFVIFDFDRVNELNISF